MGSARRECRHKTKVPVTRADAAAAQLAVKPPAGITQAQQGGVNQLMVDVLQSGEIEPAGVCTECGMPVFRRARGG